MLVITKRLILTTGLMLMTAASQAGNSVIQFRADAIQISPQNPPMEAKIYVGRNAVRTEYVINGREIVEIAHAGNKGRTILFPGEKRYIEQPGGHFQMPGTVDKRGSSPCKGVPNVTCKNLGTEMINNRKAVKWEFSNKQGKNELRSLHWIDVQHNFPVRQLFPDGTVVEMRLIKNEVINGRNTELWEWSGMRATGQSTQSRQWLDTQLNIAIREERPGGHVRELKNIKIGANKQNLFTVPNDYSRTGDNWPQSSRGLPNQ